MGTKNTKENSKITGLLFVLMSLIIVLVIILIVAKGVKDNRKPEATKTPDTTATEGIVQVATPTPTDGTSQFEETATPYSPTGEPSNTPDGSTATATAQSVTPTPTPSSKPTETPKNTNTPDPNNIYATNVDPMAGSLMDYSFMAGVSTDYFHDININDRYQSGKFKGLLCGSWWSGTEIKDSNGKITNVKRSAATEALLAKYNACYVDRTNGKRIYLTFDCGYENGQTNRILDTLKSRNVKAAFFVTTQFLGEDTAKTTCERMIAEGHIIGNHTKSHQNMMLGTNDNFVSELAAPQKKLNELLGYEYKMKFYRPPEGASSERDLALAKALGYRVAFWSFAYGDYNVNNQMDPEKALNNYLKAKIHPGAVYLLHAVSETNATILGDFIDYALSEGYTFASLADYPLSNP